MTTNKIVEIALFGKGTGECLVLNIGQSQYIIIDSFLNPKTKRPVALEYLDSCHITYDRIKLIICTHWHNDHTLGINEIFQCAPNATFVTYDIIKNERFLSYIEFAKKADGGLSSEFSKVLDYILNKKPARKIILAHHNQLLYKVDKDDSSINEEVTIYALSPQHTESLKYVASLNLPNINDFKYSLPADNDISIAIWIQIGKISMLFGGDLENKTDEEVGWRAVVKNHSVSKSKAILFKVPHHGSVTGHCEEVCSKLLNKEVVSILTTFSRSMLPTDEDKDRIKKHSSQGFVVGRIHYNDTEFKKIKMDLDKLRQDIKLERLDDNSFGCLVSKIDLVNDKWTFETEGHVHKL